MTITARGAGRPIAPVDPSTSHHPHDHGPERLEEQEN